MKARRIVARSVLLTLLGGLCVAQSESAAGPVTAPPRMVLLVRQQFQPGKASERRRLEVAMVRAFERLKAPVYWRQLESLTGPQEALYFDPMDSFDHMEKVSAVLADVYARHTELTQAQQAMDELLVSSNTMIAIRRDDLGYRTDSIDLAKARFMEVVEVRVRPGHERDFAEAAKIMGAAHEGAKVNAAAMVYQVQSGTPGPTFLVFLPMRSLSELDEILALGREVRRATAEGGRLGEIERDAYISSETNLYAASPDQSHVSEEFAASDPEYWKPAKPAAGAKKNQ